MLAYWAPPKNSGSVASTSTQSVEKQPARRGQGPGPGLARGNRMGLHGSGSESHWERALAARLARPRR
ncbi:Uncharacterised protein [Bordetella pertussis]|nr:Uncharacterised protein [Bordetella pertussis]